VSSGDRIRRKPNYDYFGKITVATEGSDGPITGTVGEHVTKNRRTMFNLAPSIEIKPTTIQQEAIGGHFA
jgi:hypothetical protein